MSSSQSLRSVAVHPPCQRREFASVVTGFLCFYPQHLHTPTSCLQECPLVLKSVPRRNCEQTQVCSSKDLQIDHVGPLTISCRCCWFPDTHSLQYHLSMATSVLSLTTDTISSPPKAGSQSHSRPLGIAAKFGYEPTSATPLMTLCNGLNHSTTPTPTSACYGTHLLQEISVARCMFQSQMCPLAASLASSTSLTSAF